MGDIYEDYLDDGNNDLEEIIEQGIECEDEGDQKNEDDEAEEDNVTGKKVEPKQRRIVKNPRPKLNEEKLKGPRGLLALQECFSNIKFRGKGHEEEDLDNILKRLEHWQYRLYPSLNFDNFLEKVEKLGHKQNIKTYLKKIRMDLITPDNNPISNEYINDEIDILFNSTETSIPKVVDPFEQLLNHNNYIPVDTESSYLTKNKTEINIDKTQEESITLTQEQIDLMEKNRQIALQKRLERIKNQEQPSLLN